MVTSVPAQLAVATVLLPTALALTVALPTPAPTTPAPTTPAPTAAPTTPAPTAAPTTPAPTAAPTTPAPIPALIPKLAIDTVHDAAYQGCFVDDGIYDELRRARRRRHFMDGEECADVCQDYEYFGTANGEDCFCGDEAPPHKATNCDIPCTANSKVACGGYHTMSVFKFKGLAADSAKDTVSLGCFEDKKKYRALDGPRDSNRRKMDAEYCSDYCMGYPFFGTKGSKQCFCGDEKPTTAKSDKCDYPCAGNEDVACGGRRSMNVYQRKTPAPTPAPTKAGPADDKAKGATLIGCFKDDLEADYVELRRARRNRNRMTAERCADICYDFYYFGTVNGQGCLCGDEALTEKAMNCKTPCSGDEDVACGGLGSLSLFKFDDELIPKM